MAENGVTDGRLASGVRPVKSSVDEDECDESVRCVGCHQLANLMCERCGDRYCSTQCQARDWIRHKKICIPIIWEHRFMYRFSPDESSWSIGDSIDTVTNTVNSAGSCKNVHGEDNIDEMLKHDELLFLTPRELRVKSIPNHTNVHITSIENHKTVFVRPSFTSADEYLCQLFDDIDHEGECNFHPLSYLPKCGGIYLAEFEEEFYRVFVLAATSRNHKIDVFFVDFGNTNCVWLNQLSELNDELKRRAILLNKICLANVPEITFSDNPIRFLKHLYEEEVELTLIFDEKTMQEGRKGNCRMRQNVCHLKFVDEELTVNQKLVRLNSKLCNMDLERCKDLVLTKHLPVFIYDITYPWKDDFNVEMQILGNSKIDSLGYLSCIRRDKRATFDRNMAAIDEYGKSVKEKEGNMLRPSLHEVCLVEKVESKKWFRALCVDPDVNQMGCKALMVLLDYDEVWKMPYSQIHKLPPALAFPVLVVDCFIQGLADLPRVPNEFKLNQNITFNSFNRVPNTVNCASVSYKKFDCNRNYNAINRNQNQ